MRTYYLFKIKGKNIENSSKKNYKVLEELFYLNSNKFKYGIPIFNELCQSFEKEKILNKLKSKFKIKQNTIIIDNFEKTIIEVNNSCIIIKTNKNIPFIFKYLNELDKNIVVCDFNNKDYFLLNDFVRINLKIII